MKIQDGNLDFTGHLEPRGVTTLIVVHHAAAKSASVQDVHRWHLSNGWVGIGYHYYIRKDGSIWRGRPEKSIGAHARGSNACSVGVCCEGDYMVETAMPAAQKASLVDLLKYLQEKYPKAKIVRHKDVGNTDCPGNNFPFREIVSRVKEEREDMTVQEVAKIVNDVNEKVNPHYDSKAEAPSWAQEALTWAMDEGILKGTGDSLDIDYNTCRIIVMLYRAVK